MAGSSEAIGLDALTEKLEELRAGDADLNSNVIDENGGVSPEIEDDVEVKGEEAKGEEAKEESEGDSEDKKEVASEEKSEGETEEEENVYSPNYQYKFQDEMFEFDKRVQSSIKSKEDEEYFRDLYTKSSAMELMKTRADEASKEIDEWQNKYAGVETKAKEADGMVEYFTKIMSGVSRGDAEAFNQFLSLCDVKENALYSIAQTLADHVDNPQGYNVTRQQYQNVNQGQQVQRERDAIAHEQAELARTRTELEVKNAISDPEILEIKEYVDNTWGPGTFEKRVWSEGEALEARNKPVNFSDIPNLVKDVADWFGKARPNTETPEEKPMPVKQRIIDNNTASLPKVQGEKGIPRKAVYEEGSGLDGLGKRYTNVTGNEW